MTRLMMTAGNAPLAPRAAKTTTPLSDLAVRLFDAVGSWSERSEQRRALAAVSDEVLHDIGVSRLDAESESEKPFWRC